MIVLFLREPQIPTSTTEMEQENSADQNNNSNELYDGELPTYVLPRCIVDFLDKDENNEPTSSPTDHDYFKALLAVETCRALKYYLHEQNQLTFFKISDKKNVISNRKTLGESLDELLQKLTAKLKSTREKMEDGSHGYHRPLVEKFLDALGANPDEKRIFRFLLCINMMPCELFGCSKTIYRDQQNRMYAMATVGASGMTASGLSTPAYVSRLFNVPLPRVMALLNPDSIYVKEG